MTPGEVLAKHNSRELSEWIAFARVEPFGLYRADVRSAIIACVIANANRDPKKKSSLFKVEDFMPKFEPEPEMSTDQTVSFIEALNAALGGEDNRQKGDGNGDDS